MSTGIPGFNCTFMELKFKSLGGGGGGFFPVLIVPLWN